MCGRKREASVGATLHARRGASERIVKETVPGETKPRNKRVIPPARGAPPLLCWGKRPEWAQEWVEPCRRGSLEK